MIKVIVRLYGSLKELLQGGETDRSLVLDLRNETTLEQLLVSLAIPVEEVVVTLVNGIAEGKSYSIKDGDLVDVFPPPIGG
ncbi:MoaD/ThiS family protein [Candidatus Bathyarchaeota archaeon]|nr:MoaD/ThiS family protein [Candidatus Bathyarchaeota archaeon]MBL7169224.1 MoaD/ThiS family protein [Candidatus Bathyarchaeota archaeon]